VPFYTDAAVLPDLWLQGSGGKSANMPLNAISTKTIATSKTIYAILIPTQADVVYSGVRLCIGTVGTAPTGFFVGLATAAAVGAKGNMLVQSSNLSASTGLTTAGEQQFPFSSTYLETGSGVNQRMVVVLEDCTNGATAITPQKAASGVDGTTVQPNSYPNCALCGTNQTALPANGAQLPANYSLGSSLCYYVELY